ncbi:23S rRNA accumulation protein YceD [Vibrio sp. SS-MA-C1-2]|uniref:23S rRNA accumulation protein YceD n=1 Tax=Vibrio sp. SS-MA-C1-2 TaxID=2908646 RepID=UPI001F27A55A|nr:23S rRNA accumulation protein YceD [Vibrio sp. SS-MA-C1-2]UJF19913.1 23S rRNA accumulation protein YceD [Vibrio sp. SS-MA-C1-2]
MQKVKLPLTIDPIKAAQKRLDYNGIVKSSLFKRLNESVQSVNSDVSVTLSFDVDEQKLTVMRGKAEAEVTLTCQRCTKGFTHNYKIEFIYSPLFKPEQIEDLPEAYEPTDLDENGEINLLEIIEDELLLALPQVAMHKLSDCSVNEGDMVFGIIPEVEEKPNPFAVLETLKTK